MTRQSTSPQTNEARGGSAAHSRWVLYYGTSSPRLKEINRDGCLRTSVQGDPKISLTTERCVAEYWACHAVFADHHDHPREESSPVDLVLNGERLLTDDYDLEECSDQIILPDEGECDWENEIACWEDIDRTAEVLIAVEPVPSQRYDDIRQYGWEAIQPKPIPLAKFELALMAHTVAELAEGECTPEEADALVSEFFILKSAISRKFQRQRLVG
jgi:hypothetical protein